MSRHIVITFCKGSYNMKDPDQVITKLIDIALQSFIDGTKPDPFAATAAHLVAQAAAAEFCEESADAAAFVAALLDISSKIQLSKYSAQLADAATKMHDAKKNYQNKMNAHAGRLLADLDDTDLSFETIVEQLDEITVGHDAHELYNATFDDKKSDVYRLALNAACSNYHHAYAWARATYIRAIALAARHPPGDKRNDVFTAYITKQFTADINQEPVDPSFFMQVMCSDVMKFFGIVLIVAALFALPIGICGLAIASVGAALVSMGLTAAIVTTTGAVATTLTGGIFAGRFFTHREWQHDNDESRNAVNAMNVYV